MIEILTELIYYRFFQQNAEHLKSSKKILFQLPRKPL